MTPPCADLLTLYLVFAIIWGVGFWGVALCAFLLYRKEQWSGVRHGTYVSHKQHIHLQQTVKIFDTSVFLAVCSLFGYLIHYSVYANDGHGVPAILIISDSTCKHSLLRSNCSSSLLRFRALADGGVVE